MVLAPLALSACLLRMHTTVDPAHLAAWSKLYPPPPTEYSALPSQMVAVVYANRRVLYPARLVFGYSGHEPPRAHAASRLAADVANQAWFDLLSIADTETDSAESGKMPAEVTAAVLPGLGGTDAVSRAEPSPKKRRVGSPTCDDAVQPTAGNADAIGNRMTPTPSAADTDSGVSGVSATAGSPSSFSADEFMKAGLFPPKRAPVIPASYAPVKMMLTKLPQRYNYRPPAPKRAPEPTPPKQPSVDVTASKAPLQPGATRSKAPQSRAFNVLDLCVIKSGRTAVTGPTDMFTHTWSSQCRQANLLNSGI